LLLLLLWDPESVQTRAVMGDHQWELAFRICEASKRLHIVCKYDRYDGHDLNCLPAIKYLLLCKDQAKLTIGGSVSVIIVIKVETLLAIFESFLLCFVARSNLFKKTCTYTVKV
jgi:hypothetical protein